MTELVFILDRSGSMRGLEADTIGGFNSVMEQHAKEDALVLVTTVLFNDRIDRIHDRIPIRQVPEMTEKEYYVRGCTALLDAVGSSIRHIAKIHKYARPEDRPTKTLFFITTDGMENASRNYDHEQVRRMITYEQEKYGWEFIFLGANIDVAREASRMGIRSDRAMRYSKRQKGTDRMFAMASDVVTAACAEAPIDDILKIFAEDKRNQD